HAMFLYYDSRLRGWGERGEGYVRFGPPEGVLYNPPGVPLNQRYPTGADYPKNVLLWLYPRLGLQVQLEDRLLTERYLLPIRMEYDPDPQVAPEVAANLDDRFATGSGRGVFSKLPPNVEARPLEGAVARFQSDRGGRLIAHLATPGSAVDSLTA